MPSDQDTSCSSIDDPDGILKAYIQAQLGNKQGKERDAALERLCDTISLKNIPSEQNPLADRVRAVHTDKLDQKEKQAALGVLKHMVQEYAAPDTKGDEPVSSTLSKLKRCPKTGCSFTYLN